MALVVLSGIGWAASGLAALLALTIVLAPLALAMVAAPTALLWAGLALVGFLLARMRGVGIAASGTLALMVCAGTLLILTAIPERINTETRAQARAIAAMSVPRRVTVGPVVTMIEMQPEWAFRDEPDLRCDGRCERALFSGFARRYALGRATEFDPQSKTQRVAIVHELVPIATGCGRSMLLGARAEDGDFPVQNKRSQLYLRDALTGSGQCVRSRRSNQLAGDIILVERLDQLPSAGGDDRAFDWRRHRVRQHRIEVYSRSQSSMLLRSRFAKIDYALLATPLRIDLPFSFAVFTPGGWTVDTWVSEGKSPPSELKELFAADFRVDYARED